MITPIAFALFLFAIFSSSTFVFFVLKFSKLSISERIKSIDTMPLMNTYNSLKKIKMSSLNKFE